MIDIDPNSDGLPGIAQLRDIGLIFGSLLTSCGRIGFKRF